MSWNELQLKMYLNMLTRLQLHYDNNQAHFQSNTNKCIIVHLYHGHFRTRVQGMKIGKCPQTFFFYNALFIS